MRMSISSPGLENVQNTNHGNHTVQLALNSDLSCAHNEGGSSNTAGTDVVNTHYYQIETHMFSIAMFHNG